MWWRVLLVGGLLAGLLGACAVVDPVDQRYDEVSRSWAKARNESIFVNLIRASYDDPLSFTTVSNVTPSMTNVTGFALPSFSLGPPNCLPSFGATGALTGRACSFPTGIPGADVGLSNSTASNNTTISSNFSISTQETSAFYDGFLKPIDLQTLNYFIRQGYPRELLFWLFADSFQLQYGTSPLSSIGYQYNPPDSYGCPREDPEHRCFREWVWIALLSGLTVEEKTIVTKFSSKYDTTPVARFCFSPELAQKARNEMMPAVAAEIKRKYMKFVTNPSPVCGTWDDKDAAALLTNPQPDTFSFRVGTATFRVVPRSAYGVFEFLGNLIRMQRDNIEPTAGKAFFWSPPLGEPDEAEVPPRLRTVDGGPPLIEVMPNSGGICFVHTWYLNSDFCVPENASTTKLIFSLLAQLIAIETEASDLSITPIVRVIQ
jgi:hypothetical protein